MVEVGKSPRIRSDNLTHTSASSKLEERQGLDNRYQAECLIRLTSGFLSGRCLPLLPRAFQSPAPRAATPGILPESYNKRMLL